MIFDSHCHLNDDELYKNIDTIIAKSTQNGVNAFVVVGWDRTSSIRAVEIAEKYKNVFAAIGFHPMNTEDIKTEEFNEVFSYVSHPKVVAIGEIGLDYHWESNTSKKEIQKTYFIKQIEIANKYNKPIIIHSRDSFEDTITILKHHKPLFSGTFHCYGGSSEGLNEVLKLNLYIGLDGPVTFKNARVPKEVASIVPLEKLLLETDCPYLTPHPYRGQTNDPSFLPIIASEISRIKGVSYTDICDATWNNTCKLFRIKL